MPGFARLVEPPRLRTVETMEKERRATWLELFFGLDVWLRLATAAVALVLLGLGSALSPLAVVWTLAGILATRVVVELAGHEEHVAPETSPVPGS